MSVGITICLLGYSNSYGFLVCGVAAMVASLYYPIRVPKRRQLLLAGATIPLVVALPFFVRNALIYHGDAMGVATFQAQNTAWEQSHGGLTQHNFYEITGAPFTAMFSDAGTQQILVESSIATFGKLSIHPTAVLLVPFKLFGLGVLGCIIALVYRTVIRVGQGVYTRNLRREIFASYMVGASGLTVGLSAYYTYTIDYQPQGRYTLYLLIPAILVWVYCCARAQTTRTVGRLAMVVTWWIVLSCVLTSFELFARYIAYMQ